MKAGKSIELLPDDRLTISEGSGQARPFAFDAVFNPETTQEEVFERTGALVLEKALQGYNVTLFAYGQTGTESHFCTAVLIAIARVTMICDHAGSGKTYKSGRGSGREREV